VEATEFERARAVAEKALKTIHFREQREKFNVWVALLNLESLYGTQQSLDKVVERAVQFNEPFKVYSQLAKIYEATNKLPVCLHLCLFTCFVVRSLCSLLV
jgi:rRNA biogenesis protein RRP5